MDQLDHWATRVVTALQDGAYDELTAALIALPASAEAAALLAVLRAGQRSGLAPAVAGVPVAATPLVAVPVAATPVDPSLVLVPNSPPARLLRAIGAFPGRAGGELREVTLLDEDGFAAAARHLLDAGLVSSTRFDKPDCWTRTNRGSQAARLLDQA